MSTRIDIDPGLDLVLERVVDVSPERVWQAWTRPEHLVHWFAPHPWKAEDVVVDLRPGGAFGLTMKGPTGESFPSMGCYLEVEPDRRLVWTDALGPGYRPNAESFFTSFVLLEPEGSGTRYTAIARHGDAAARAKHEEMGFHGGWSTCLDQLVLHMSSTR